jgi:salicylate hydroxylase
MRIAIIGGGIGGLTAALALKQRGFEVTAYEQSSQLGEIGAGVGIAPNAVKAFRSLGLENELLAIGWTAESQIMRNGQDGRIISRQPIADSTAKFGAPHLTVHRADLLNVLVRALPETCIRTAARCVSVTSDSNGAVARFSDGSEIESDVVVGADGIHSVVRTSLLGPEAPRFTGCVCYRGLIPAADVPSSITMKDTVLWMGPHGHIVHYPVKRGELLNVVAHYDSDAWTEESWTRKCNQSELVATYANWHESLLRLIQSNANWYKWALYDREPLEQWSVGRVTLLGDSAHAMLPYLGQGAAMAIEDGCVLASCLSKAKDAEEALETYEQLRKPRTRRTVLASRARAKENHLASRWDRLKRDVKIAFRNRFAKDKTVFQGEWLYAYDVGAADGGSAIPAGRAP